MKAIPTFVLCGVLGTRATAIADPMGDADPLTVVGHRHPLDADPCIESDDVLGYRQCSHFGEWADARLGRQLILEAGAILRGAPAAALGATHHALTIQEPDQASSGSSESGALRALVGIGRSGYAGLEADVGELDTAPAHNVIVDYLGVVGFAAAAGPFDVGAELALGGSTVTSAKAMNSDIVVEPRARIEVWLSPWFTVGGQVGADLLTEGTWMTGVYIGFHSYSFGGLR